jgi:hypothetical protein
MAKTVGRKNRIVRREWTVGEVKELKQHSKDRTPVKTVSRSLKRTQAAVRHKAMTLGLPLGHRRSKKK